VEGISRSACVWARVGDGVLDLWAVIPERDRAVEKAVAAAACELMRKHVELDLDFMVVAADSPSAAGLGEAGYRRVGRRGTG